MSVTRRQFLRRSSAAAATLALPMVASSRVLGANEEIRVAVVGCGVRGGTHVAAVRAARPASASRRSAIPIANGSRRSPNASRRVTATVPPKWATCGS